MAALLFASTFPCFMQQRYVFMRQHWLKNNLIHHFMPQQLQFMQQQ